MTLSVSHSPNTPAPTAEEAAIAYKNRIDAQREQTLAELALQAQELNLGYE